MVSDLLLVLNIAPLVFERYWNFCMVFRRGKRTFYLALGVNKKVDINKLNTYNIFKKTGFPDKGAENGLRLLPNLHR
jgi:hypothetical protein